jgi:hypothetical protein
MPRPNNLWATTSMGALTSTPSPAPPSSSSPAPRPTRTPTRRRSSAPTSPRHPPHQREAPRSRTLGRVLATALAKTPAERFVSCEQFTAAFRQAVGSDSTSAQPAQAAIRPAPPCPSSPPPIPAETVGVEGRVLCGRGLFGCRRPELLVGLQGVAGQRGQVVDRGGIGDETEVHVVVVGAERDVPGLPGARHIVTSRPSIRNDSFMDNSRIDGQRQNVWP